MHPPWLRALPHLRQWRAQALGVSACQTCEAAVTLFIELWCFACIENSGKKHSKVWAETEDRHGTGTICASGMVCDMVEVYNGTAVNIVTTCLGCHTWRKET
jgi:hypothetical protein